MLYLVMVLESKAVMFPLGLRVHFQGQKHSFGANKGQQRYVEDKKTKSDWYQFMVIIQSYYFTDVIFISKTCF